MITDIIVGLIFLLFVGLGFFRGFIRSMVSLAKIPVTIAISFFLAGPVSSLLDKIGFLRVLSGWIGLGKELTGIITLIAIAVMIFIIIRVILWKLVKASDKAKEKKRTYNKIDRLLGAVFGLVHFVVIFTLISISFAIVNWVFSQAGVDFYSMIFKGSHVAAWLYKFILGIASSFF